MNLKKIERGITEILYASWANGKIPFIGYEGRDGKRRWQREQLFRLFCRMVKQVVESVPVEKDNYKGLPNSVYNEWDFSEGYNRHVRQIKQWKKKILKELEEVKCQ